VHSSISSSETRPARGHSGFVLLLAVLAVLSLAVEAGTRLGFANISSIQRRIRNERTAARTVQHSPDPARPAVLFLGNSLVLEDVDFPALRASLSNRASASRYVIESTRFLDWYFAFHRLIQEGSRPDAVILGLSGNQLVSRLVLGEYFGHYMMSASDLPRVASETGMTATETSNLFFARPSAWQGSKSDVRSWILAHTLADSGRLAAILGNGTQVEPNLSDFGSLIESRLRMLKSLAADSGSTVALLVMPNPKQSDRDTEVIRRCAERAGVSVIVPVGMKDLPLSLYSDGFHLSRDGGREFTPRLSAAVRDWLNHN
jgi:hypothetical protein